MREFPQTVIQSIFQTCSCNRLQAKVEIACSDIGFVRANAVNYCMILSHREFGYISGTLIQAVGSQSCLTANGLLFIVFLQWLSSRAVSTFWGTN